MNSQNRKEISQCAGLQQYKKPTPVTIEEAEEQGYEPCKKCY